MKLFFRASCPRKLGTSFTASLVPVNRAVAASPTRCWLPPPQARKLEAWLVLLCQNSFDATFLWSLEIRRACVYVRRQGYTMNNHCYLLICCNFKCDGAREAVISGCGDRLGVSHHGFLFMFPTAVKPVGGKKKTTNQSRPSKTPLLGNQEAVRALMKRCHSLGWHKQAVDNWLPAANENLLMPQPAGFFLFIPSDRRCFIAAVNITLHAEFMLILISIHSSRFLKAIYPVRDLNYSIILRLHL